MGRHRSTGDASLPPRLHRKGNSFYYVTSETPRRWIPLGNNLNLARVQWAQLENDPSGFKTMETLMHAYLGKACDEHAPSTQAQYKSFAKCLMSAFPDTPLESIKPPMLAMWRDNNKHRKSFANGCLTVGRLAFKKGIEWGWCELNPFASIELFKMHPRTRIVTTGEFLAVHSHAVWWMQDAMDLAYLTGLRRGDVAGLKWSQVGETISVTQQKTGKRQSFAISADCAQLLERCKQRKILGLFVISGDKGRGISSKMIERHMSVACFKAGVKDFTFHDIRAMYAAAAEAAGQDYQAGLGHSTKAMSDRYLRAKRAIQAPTLLRKL